MFHSLVHLLTLAELGHHEVNHLHVYARGNHTGKPVMLLVPTFPCVTVLASISDEILTSFEETHNLVFYDTRGVGRSSGSEPNAGWEGHVTDAVSVARWAVSYFAKENLTVWGYSFGTMLAMDASSRANDIVSKVILTNLKVDVQRSSFIMNQAIEQVWGLPTILTSQLPPEMVLNAALLGPFRYACMHQPRTIECFTGFLYPDVRMVFDVYGVEHLLPYPLQFAKCFVNVRNELPDLRLSSVSHVDAPLFIAHGRHDYIDAATLVETAIATNSLPSSSYTIEWMYESGHAPLVEEKERYMAVMRQFMVA